jgi:hypothetical protein
VAIIAQNMRDQKVWAKVPLTRISKALLLLFAAIGFIPVIHSLFDQKPIPYKETLILWAVLIILYRIIALWKMTIATDEQGLHIRSVLNDELILWEDISNYFVNENQIIFYTHQNTQPYTVNFQFLKEKEAFIELLWSKYQKIEAIDCLHCGESITPDESQCPHCGWTWEKQLRGGNH